MVCGVCGGMVSQRLNTVQRGGSVVVALDCCKPSTKNQVSIVMTTFLFYITIVLLLAYAHYLRQQLKK